MQTGGGEVQNASAEGARTARELCMADIAVLEPVRDYKARHASTLLTFDAVVEAIGKVEASRSAA